MPKKLTLPRENLFRAVYAVPMGGANTARAVGQPTTGRTLELQWYIADTWTEIDSWYEGNFMERIALGAAAKTIRENAANMRILLQHGKDPQLGDKPIASLDLVEENDIGGYAEGELFNGLDPLVVDGIRAGQYGASFRFRVMRDEIEQEPEPSDYNPKGLPERTIKEMGVQEFGPVTWGAYSAASAGVRSITDEMHFGHLKNIPEDRLGELIEFWRTRTEGQRVDSEDMGHIAQMLVCGSAYIEDQDESDEFGNVTTMEEVLTLLSSLVQVEAAEVEPDEPEDEGEYSAPDTDDVSRREAGPVEAPGDEPTPTTDRYLSKRQPSPGWFLP